MSNYYETMAQCPFFVQASARDCKITCEGLVSKSSVILWFRRKKDWDIQYRTFCCHSCSKCEIYQAIMAAKYQND